MGYYEDHIAAVAERMAKKHRDGADYRVIYKYLYRAGWTEAETAKIIELSKKKEESIKILTPQKN